MNDGLEDINDVAFSGMKSLEQITIPSSVRKLSTTAFYYSRSSAENPLLVNIEGKYSMEDFENSINSLVTGKNWESKDIYYYASVRFLEN